MQIMDGSPSRGETIPIRLFLGGFDLTPTFREVNKKFSTRYYLSLVLIDEGIISTPHPFHSHLANTLLAYLPWSPPWQTHPFISLTSRVSPSLLVSANDLSTFSRREALFQTIRNRPLPAATGRSGCCCGATTGGTRAGRAAADHRAPSTAPAGSAAAQESGAGSTGSRLIDRSRPRVVERRCTGPLDDSMGKHGIGKEHGLSITL